MVKQLKSKLIIRVLANYPNASLKINGKETKLSLVKLDEVTDDDLERLKYDLIDNESSQSAEMAKGLVNNLLVIENYLREKVANRMKGTSLLPEELKKIKMNHETLSKERIAFGETLTKIQSYKLTLIQEIEAAQKKQFDEDLVKRKERIAEEMKKLIAKNTIANLDEKEKQRKRAEEMKKKEEEDEKKKKEDPKYNQGSDKKYKTDRYEKGDKGEKNDLFKTETPNENFSRMQAKKETLTSEETKQTSSASAASTTTGDLVRPQTFKKRTIA